MKNTSTFRFRMLVTIIVFLLSATTGYSQQKHEDQATNKKTFTIHVTQEVDGKTVVLDTTIVTADDFDVDGFLQEKGLKEEIEEEMKKAENEFSHRESEGTSVFRFYGSDDETPDTIIIDNDRVIIRDKRSDFHFDTPIELPELPDIQEYNYFNPPHGFQHPTEIPIEEMLRGMAYNFGLDKVMPFGDMKQIVVKKKRHGKKVIITFEDRDNEEFEWNESCCPRGHRNKERVIIYKNGKDVEMPDEEGHVIIEPGKKVIIEGDVKIANPEKQHKKVVIIREDKTKQE